MINNFLLNLRIHHTKLLYLYLHTHQITLYLINLINQLQNLPKYSLLGPRQGNLPILQLHNRTNLLQRGHKTFIIRFIEDYTQRLMHTFDMIDHGTRQG